MAIIKIKNKCRNIRTMLQQRIALGLNLENGWIAGHITTCPRCQQRLSRFGRINLALSLLKSQPHSLSLLMRANTQAVGVLKHSLRNAPRAESLRTAKPEPGFFRRQLRYATPICNVAACIVVVALLKAGIFSSMENLQDQGEQTMQHYYAKHLDEDTFNEIFNA